MNPPNRRSIEIDSAPRIAHIGYGVQRQLTNLGNRHDATTCDGTSRIVVSGLSDCHDEFLREDSSPLALSSWTSQSSRRIVRILSQFSLLNGLLNVQLILLFILCMRRECGVKLKQLRRIVKRLIIELRLQGSYSVPDCDCLNECVNLWLGHLKNRLQCCQTISTTYCHPPIMAAVTIYH